MTERAPLKRLSTFVNSVNDEIRLAADEISKLLNHFLLVNFKDCLLAKSDFQYSCHKKVASVHPWAVLIVDAVSSTIRSSIICTFFLKC